MPKRKTKSTYVDPITTKVTLIKTGLWGCRVFYNGKLIIEAQVDSKGRINDAFRAMLRMMDKLGWVSKLADASRFRQKPYNPRGIKFYWGGRQKEQKNAKET
jgi:hypothetical protein